MERYHSANGWQLEEPDFTYTRQDWERDVALAERSPYGIDVAAWETVFNPARLCGNSPAGGSSRRGKRTERRAVVVDLFRRKASPIVGGKK